jgi:hypothetical protein
MVVLVFHHPAKGESWLGYAPRGSSPQARRSTPLRAFDAKMPR